MVINRPINRFRRKVGAPPMKGGIIPESGDALLNLLPVSRHIVPPNPRWAEGNFITGYWFADQPDWTPPADLCAFLDAGERPVVVSLGAMSIGALDAQETAGIVLQAAAQADMRLIVQGWDDVWPSLDAPETVFHAGPMPHGWLFAQAAAAAHHGGFGTTASGFRAGVPAVVIPHILDQFYWGERVQANGCGPAPIARKKLTVEALCAAFDRAARDSAMRATAARLGEQVRAEDGLREAVRLIEELG